MQFQQLQQPIFTKLKACEETSEAWSVDHENAKRLYRFEDLLSDVCECYDNVQRLDQWYASEVALNPSNYCEDSDDQIVSLCERLHSLAEFIEAELLPNFEREYDVSHVVDFRQRLDKARQSKRFGYRMEATQSTGKLISEICQSIGF